MIAAIGAQKGRNHSATKVGSLAVPSHQVGLPTFRLEMATAAKAAVMASHVMTVMAAHGWRRDVCFDVVTITPCRVQEVAPQLA